MRKYRAAMGCALALLVASGVMPPSVLQGQQGPTWVEDVGPIFADKCMNCHRPGQIAPMSLLTYEDVRPWAPSIGMMVGTRIMPPWHADPAYGDFGNDRRLSDEQVETVLAWVDAGAPRGEGEFPAPEFASATDGFLLTGELGPPDYVFRMEEGYVVPAGGVDINIDIPVPTNLEEDIWVQAAEVRGNFNVVHHNVVSIIGPDGEYARTGRLASTVPGKQWDRFPVGSGKLIEAGSTLDFGLHYHPSNESIVDTSSVAVWLVRDPITHELHSSVVADPDLQIPPFEPNYESSGEFVFDVDAAITLFKPHMHYRGKDMLYRAHFPDGTSEILLSVPSYDMNWQISYEFAEPVHVPKGTRLEVVAHFDNSPDNPWNPDPSVQVLWGGDSRDEMMEGWFDYQVELDEPILPEHLGGPSGAFPSADPTGIWNLETRNLAERATGGVRNVLLRVEEEGGTLAAQMTSPQTSFLDVQEFSYEDGEMVVRFGAYLYALTMAGDRLTGTMTSPVDTLFVTGRRQEGSMLGGDEPVEYVATRTGLLGHRTELGPPEDEADPASWVRERLGSVEDFALILRGIPVSFTNPQAFEQELTALAGQRVNVTGAWIGELYRIDHIESAGEER